MCVELLLGNCKLDYWYKFCDSPNWEYCIVGWALRFSTLESENLNDLVGNHEAMLGSSTRCSTPRRFFCFQNGALAEPRNY